MDVVIIRPGAHRTSLIDKTYQILDQVDPDSVYQNQLANIKKSGQKILLQTKNDPLDVARVIHKALTDKRPKRYYHVNVSLRFKVLKLLPRALKEWIIRGLLNKKAGS